MSKTKECPLLRRGLPLWLDITGDTSSIYMQVSSLHEAYKKVLKLKSEGFKVVSWEVTE